MEVHFAYAQKNGIPVHVSEVDRGLSCGCTCGECGGVLVAKKGGFVAEHFAHKSNVDCKNAPESNLHKMAKAMIAEMSSIIIPDYIFHMSGVLKKHKYWKVNQDGNYIKLISEGSYNVNRVLVENKLGNITPDLIMSLDNDYQKLDNLIVEVAFTHKVDKRKLRKIRRLNIPAVEIYLDRHDAMLSPEVLKHKLQNDLQSKKWLYHPLQQEHKLEYAIKYRSELYKERRWRKSKEAMMLLQEEARRLEWEKQKIANEEKKNKEAKDWSAKYDFFSRPGM